MCTITAYTKQMFPEFSGFVSSGRVRWDFFCFRSKCPSARSTRRLNGPPMSRRSMSSILNVRSGSHMQPACVKFLFGLLTFKTYGQFHAALAIHGLSRRLVWNMSVDAYGFHQIRCHGSRRGPSCKELPRPEYITQLVLLGHMF